MKIKQTILDSLNGSSKKALDFLKAKRDAIKKKESILLKTETSIVRGLGEKGMTETQQKTIEGLKGELNSEEFNESDIMREQTMMSQLSQDIQMALGKPLPSYSNGLKQLKSEKDKYSNYNGVLESKFKAIKEESLDKQNLREKIVFNEQQLSKATEKYSSFSEQFSAIYKSIQERDAGKGNKEGEKKALLEKLGLLQDRKQAAEQNLNKVYKDSVDLSLVLKDVELDREESERVNELFKTNESDLIKKTDEVGEVKDSYENSLKGNVDCADELTALEVEMYDLTSQIKIKDTEIDTLDAEKDWLLAQNVAQAVQIDTLSRKLQVWESQYKIFKTLVLELATFVGYPLGSTNDKLNATGVIEEENPLIPLIQQIEDITKWVEEQEELVPEPEEEEEIVIKEHNHTGYIIGGAVLAALAFMIKK